MGVVVSANAIVFLAFFTLSTCFSHQVLLAWDKALKLLAHGMHY